MTLSESSPQFASRRGVGAYADLDGDRTVVWFRGEHDAPTATALSQTIPRAIGLDDPEFVINPRETQVVGAATVEAIIQVRALFGRRSRSFVLRSHSPHTRRSLEECGLAGPLEADAADATSVTAAAGVLGTWGAEPTTDRLDRCTDRAALESGDAPVPGGRRRRQRQEVDIMAQAMGGLES